MNILHFVRIDRKKKEAVYLQIVFQLINAIQRRLILEGEKLPGTRVIAEKLGVHRKTVVKAIEELQAQGWLETKNRSGTFVSYPIISSEQIEGVFRNETKNQANFTFTKSYLLDSPYAIFKQKSQWNEGRPDYSLAPLEEVNRYYRSAMKRKQVQRTMNDLRYRTNPYFIQQLSYYLNLTKKLHISPENIAISAQNNSLLYAISKILLTKNDLVLVGELGSYKANMLFKQMEANIQTIPVDSNGIIVSEIRKRYKKGEIRLLYLNSMSHYPTTVSMSLERKKEVLQLAEEYDFILLDDNEWEEFVPESTTSSLYKMEGANRLIFVGAFGRMFQTTYQYAYVLGPKDFIQEVEKFLTMLEPQTDKIVQQALGEMIEEGDFFRITKKMSRTYKERLKNFTKQLQTLLSDEVILFSDYHELAVWLPIYHPAKLKEVLAKLKQIGGEVPHYCIYQKGIRIGVLTTVEGIQI